MKVKQILAVTATCAILAGTLAVPAMAHGGHHSRRAAVTYPTCATQDCAITYRHDHDGTTYCGHTAADGHNWHSTGRHGGRCR